VYKTSNNLGYSLAIELTDLVIAWDIAGEKVWCFSP